MAYTPFKNKATIYQVFNGSRKLFQSPSLNMAKREAQKRANKLRSKKFFISIKKVSLVGFHTKE